MISVDNFAVVSQLDQSLELDRLHSLLLGKVALALRCDCNSQLWLRVMNLSLHWHRAMFYNLQ